MREPVNSFKKLGFIAAGLCVACCALPVFGLLISAGTLAIVSQHLTWAGISMLIIAILYTGVYYYRKRRLKVCDIDCVCKMVTKEK
jgi:hypothetical protein